VVSVDDIIVFPWVHTLGSHRGSDCKASALLRRSQDFSGRSRARVSSRSRRTWTVGPNFERFELRVNYRPRGLRYESVLRQLTTPITATLLIVGLVVGAIGGYLVSSQFNRNPVAASAFLQYNDSFGGPIDDSSTGFIHASILVAGFSRGQIAWYWLVGPTNSSVNPAYFFQYQSGGDVQGQHPIVDVKPGDSSYTHFWEVYNVTVPNSYTANTIKSLSSLNRAQQAGLVTITDAKRAINGPLVAKNVKITVVNGEPQFQTVWYRTDLTTMAIFETNLPSGGVPSIPIWLIQRAGDSCPLLEAVCNKDLNHDSDLKDSNDLIGVTPGQAGYFPLWDVSILHVNDTYLPNGFPSPFPQNPAILSAPTSQGGFGMYTSLDAAQNDESSANPLYVNIHIGARGLTHVGLVNCPTLPLGVNPADIASS
jgi:hypothetical protein